MKISLNSENKDTADISKSALEEMHMEVSIVEDKESADFKVEIDQFKKSYDEGEHLITEATLTDKEDNKFKGNGTEIHLYEETTEEVDNDKLLKESVQRAYVSYLIEKTDLKSEFRQKSSAVVVDDDENFLLVQLHSYGENDWNFCGGGLEEGEDEREAMLRELEEELGTDSFEIVKKSDYRKQYDWPVWMIAGDIIKAKRKAYRGQEEAYFLVKFTGNKDEIKFQEDEIKAVKWIKYDELKDHLNFSRHKGIVEEVIDGLIA